MKKFSFWFSSGVFKLSILSLALVAGLLSVVGSPNKISSALEQSGIYTKLPELFELQTSGDPNDQSSDLQNNIDVKKLVSTAFPPKLLQDSTEEIINGFYKWFDGKTEEPEFEIDLTQAKAEFIVLVGQEAEAHVDSLPVCTAAQLKNIAPDTDPFELPCRPPHISGEAARNQIVTKLSSDENFLPDPVITAKDLPINESGQTLSEQLKGPRDGYQIIKKLPIILTIFALVSIGGVYLSSKDRRQALKSLGISLLGAGGILLLTVGLGSYLLGSALKPTGNIGRNISNPAQEIGIELAKTANDSYGRTVLIYSLVYLVIGAALLILRKYIPATVASDTSTTNDRTPKDTP